MSAYDFTVKRISPMLGTSTIDNVQSFTTFRGRRRSLDTYAAGSFSVTCRNPALPINLGNGLKIEVDSGSAIEDSVFYGFINDGSWTYFYDQDGDVLTLSGVDVFGQYGSQQLSYSQPESNAGDALKLLFEEQEIDPDDLGEISTSAVGPPSPTPGISIIPVTTVSAQTYVNKPAIEAINEIVASEQGRVWTTTQGAFRFRPRNEFNQPTVSFSDETNNSTHQVYSQISFTTTTQDYFTQVTVEPEGLTAQTAVAIGASEPYRSFTVRTQNVSEADAEALAEYLANLLSSPVIDIASITCVAEAQASPQLTVFDIADQVTVRFRGDDYTAVIEGIEVSARPGSSEFTFYFSAADRNAYLILDNPTFGKLDENKLGF